MPTHTACLRVGIGDWRHWAKKREISATKFRPELLYDRFRRWRGRRLRHQRMAFLVRGYRFTRQRHFLVLPVDGANLENTVGAAPITPKIGGATVVSRLKCHRSLWREACTSSTIRFTERDHK